MKIVDSSKTSTLDLKNFLKIFDAILHVSFPVVPLLEAAGRLFTVIFFQIVY